MLNFEKNASCTQARKTTHGLGGQHQYVDRTPRGSIELHTYLVSKFPADALLV